MKHIITVLAIGTALVITATTLVACDDKPTTSTTNPTTIVTTVTTQVPTTTLAENTTATTAKTTATTTKTTATASKAAIATTRPTTTTIAKPATTAPTTHTAAPTHTTVVTQAPTTVTTAAPTTAAPTTTVKQTTTAAPKTTTTAKPTTTTTKKTTTTTKPTAPTYTVTDAQLRQIRDEFFKLVNEERVRVGVEPLSLYSHLNDCAAIRSREAIEYWSHNRPDGSLFNTVIDDDVYLYWTLGENLCQTTHFGGGYYNESYRWTGSDEQIQSAAQWTFDTFKNSSGHYENMIKAKFEDTGIGVSYAWVDEGIPLFYTAQLFGAGEKM